MAVLTSQAIWSEGRDSNPHLLGGNQIYYPLYDLSKLDAMANAPHLLAYIVVRKKVVSSQQLSSLLLT